MVQPRAIFEEFCESLHVKTRSEEGCAFRIECRLKTRFFTALMERLKEVGYCCIMAQRDPDGDMCTAWFTPTEPFPIIFSED